MKLLAIETATEALSVAVLIDDTVHAHHEIAPRRHGELLLPTIDQLLTAAGLTLTDLDAIAFGRGPGAFTGVRIAIAAAQGLAYGAGLKLVPVSTLAALAQDALNSGESRVIAAIDARMGEVYAACFTADADGLAELTGEEWLGKAADFTAPKGKWFGTGTGFGAYPDDFAAKLSGVDPTALPSAAATVRLAEKDLKAGKAVDPEHAMPVYLRDQVTS